MRSIRRSLIVYFLILVTAALGAVSWFAYRTSAHSLRQRQHDSQALIEAQCATRVQEVRDELDRRILHQVHRMASTARASSVHFNGFFPLGVVGASVLGEPHLNIYGWALQGTYPSMAPRPPTDFTTHIKIADDLIPASDSEHDCYQTYLRDGHVMQRSDSMGECRFALDEKLRDHQVLWTESFDKVEVRPGLAVRRVTLKSMVPGNRSQYIPWQALAPVARGGPKGPSKAGGVPMPRPADLRGDERRFKAPPPPKWFFGWRGGLESATPVFFQYASDLAPTEAKVLAFQAQRDEQLAQLNVTIDNDLRQLRDRMGLIALATLAALWLGGYLVICLGLAPLAKMTEAVSKVSARNFHLLLETEKLPDELQPIAVRLEQALGELRKAFAREKQAAADISHELRTPVAALMTTLEVGLRKPRSSAEYREILEECRGTGQHMYQLIERLLRLARLDAGADQYRPREVDAVEIALGCADLIRPLARARGLELRLHLPDPAPIHTDPDKLREVVTNLLHNAVEYNRPDGMIELSVECVRDDNHIECVRIEVRDTGSGISPAAQAHIFERFFRADPSRHADTPHAGLGLAIVKSYIDLMKGDIRVVSSDAGTTFIVELPLLKARVPVATAIQVG